MLGWFADPWQDPILRRAFLDIVLLGVTSGAIGCWAVFYNLSYSAESLSHAMLPGLVVAALTGLPLLLGGAAGMLVGALGVAVVGRVPEIGRDTGVAVVVTTLFGLGVLLALSPDTPPRLQDLLFGDVLGVTDGDLALAGGLVVIALGSLAILHGRLLIVGFDRASAPALGVRPGVIDAALLVLLAVVLIVAVRALGNLLVVAILIAPAAAARLVAHRIGAMLVVSSAIAIAGGWGGLYLSFHAGTAAGASIAGVLVVAYLAAAICGTVRTSRAARSRAQPRRT